jgi:hypothetical protein
VQPCQRPSTSFRLLFSSGKNRSTIENDEISCAVRTWRTVDDAPGLSILPAAFDVLTPT